MGRKLTNKQQAKDSEVMGVILAGMHTHKKATLSGLSATETKRGMCAIGAGNRGRKVTRIKDIFQDGWGISNKLEHQLIPMVRFAMANGVSENYACGVNDGFEQDTDNKTASERFYPKVNKKSLDYERGLNVGMAARAEADEKGQGDD